MLPVGDLVYFRGSLVGKLRGRRIEGASHVTSLGFASPLDRPLDSEHVRFGSELRIGKAAAVEDGLFKRGKALLDILPLHGSYLQLGS